DAHHVAGGGFHHQRHGPWGRARGAIATPWGRLSWHICVVNAGYFGRRDVPNKKPASTGCGLECLCKVTLAACRFEHASIVVSVADYLGHSPIPVMK
ncbi:MAG TPA: hypothetical protein PLD79_04295, partial [Halothiobacillus sp.]|nr:hypothetical protein [Halothiobacillus sp.]